MSISETNLSEFLPTFPAKLIESIVEQAQILTVPAQTKIVRKGQYLKSVPILLKGLVKVYTQYGDKELLLYYIKPVESCVMSFTAVINNDSSHIEAVTEETSELLLLPTEQFLHWMHDYPVLGRMYHKQYYVRYNDLIETIQQLLFEQLDHRLLRYLKEKTTQNKGNSLHVLHREIASDLGSSREVISRTLKKLERDGSITLKQGGIQLVKDV